MHALTQFMKALHWPWQRTPSSLGARHRQSAILLDSLRTLPNENAHEFADLPVMHAVVCLLI